MYLFGYKFSRLFWWLGIIGIYLVFASSSNAVGLCRNGQVGTGPGGTCTCAQEQGICNIGIQNSCIGIATNGGYPVADPPGFCAGLGMCCIQATPTPNTQQSLCDRLEGLCTYTGSCGGNTYVSTTTVDYGCAYPFSGCCLPNTATACTRANGYCYDSSSFSQTVTCHSGHGWVDGTQSCGTNDAAIVCCIAPTPTPTPLPLCTSGISNCSTWTTPPNSCATNNASRTCTYTTTNTGSTQCRQQTVTQLSTIDACTATYLCLSGTCVTTISGQVYIDTNNNGKQDIGEDGMAGVVVSGNGTTVTTDGNGLYTFSNLPSGTYTISITVPPHYISSTTNPYTITLGTAGTISFGITPSYAIAGSIYVDVNKNLLFDSVDNLYTTASTVDIKNTQGVTVTTITTSFGIYNSGTILPAGIYTVTISPPSNGYTIAYPKPPTFQVTIGMSPTLFVCDVNNAHDAICTSGNIDHLNFALSNEHVFFQGVCTDMRSDSGFIDPLPNTGTCGSVNNRYASITDATCMNPGIIYAGDGTTDFGQGAASVTNWVVGNTSYAENFTPVNPTVIRTSYEYLVTSATHAGITPRPLTTICPFLSDCLLSEELSHGIYQANGDVTISNTSFTFPPHTSVIILIDGTLSIKGRILVPDDSFVLFATTGDILVDGSVGEDNPTSWDATLQGFYSTDRSFILETNATNATCNTDGTPLDKRINITGSIIVNAAYSGGTFQNKRDLCLADLSCPTYTLSMGMGNISGNRSSAGTGATYLLAAPPFIKHQNTLWKEETPR